MEKIAILVGAYKDIGYMKRLFSRGITLIYAFEPQPTNFEEVCQDALEFGGKVSPIRAACWNKEGELKLYLSHISRLSHSVFKEKYNIDPNLYITVKCIDLAKFIKEHGEIEVLKLSCEGAEFEILTHLFETGVIDMVKELVVIFEGPKMTNFDVARWEPLYTELKKWRDSGHVVKVGGVLRNPNAIENSEEL
jgi:FkbM family methyltransferase